MAILADAEIQAQPSAKNEALHATLFLVLIGPTGQANFLKHSWSGFWIIWKHSKMFVNLCQYKTMSTVWATVSARTHRYTQNVSRW